MKPLSAIIFILTVIVAGCILLCPLYFMFARSPWCIFIFLHPFILQHIMIFFMFIISWLPAFIVGRIGLGIAEAIEGK